MLLSYLHKRDLNTLSSLQCQPILLSYFPLCSWIIITWITTITTSWKFIMYHSSSLKSCHLNVSPTCDIVTMIIPTLLMKKWNHKETQQLAKVTFFTGEGLEFKPKVFVCRAHSPNHIAFFCPCFSRTGKFPVSSMHCTACLLAFTCSVTPKRTASSSHLYPPNSYLSLFQVSFKCQHLLDCCCWLFDFLAWRWYFYSGNTEISQTFLFLPCSLFY